MSQTNYITLTGYVTAEPKLGKTTTTGTPVTRIRVGSTPRRLDRQTGEWRDGETSYYDVVCWRKLAENVAGSLRKGDMILVRGRFHTRTWVDDQQRTRVQIEVDADSVGHDMSFGWSHFNRGVHMSPSVARGIAEGEARRQGMGPDADADFPSGPDDYDDYANLSGDVGYDGASEAGLTPDGPDDPRAPRGASYADDREPSDEDAFGEVTSDLGESVEEPAAL